MIRYALKCEAGHDFESWFQSAAAFDGLKAGGLVNCPVCGGNRVDKALMAPQLSPSREADRPREAEARADAPLSAPTHPFEAFVRALRRKVSETCDYVGEDFAAEARAIHLGEAPRRGIYGEARPEEARELIAEGIPVAPLPFLPPRKSN